MTRSPRRLLLTATRCLTLRLTASMLPCANSIIGKEPAMTDTTRTLPGRRHDDPSSPRLVEIFSCNLDCWMGGTILDCDPGSILKSAEECFLRLLRMTLPFCILTSRCGCRQRYLLLKESREGKPRFGLINPASFLVFEKVNALRRQRSGAINRIGNASSRTYPYVAFARILSVYRNHRIRRFTIVEP